MRSLALLCGVLTMAACTQDEKLVPDRLILGDAIPKPLTPEAGDPHAGQAVFVEREQGHCVLCHQIKGLDAAFQGNLGPELSDVGARLSPGQIRLRIVDYQTVKPGTVMPSYYRTHDLHQVVEENRDRPVLTAQQVEDLVAYLSTFGAVHE